MTYEASRARLVPKGSRFVFQMHYTPNGKAQSDITKVGMVFADENEVKEELLTMIALDQDFEIPPNAASHKVEVRRGQLPERGRLLAVSPHMHYRGKSFISSVIKDDDSTEPIISVPNYDFNWQHRYEFAQPISLSGLSRLQATVEFDNSKANPFNPDPSQMVSWGDQTWEEMAVAFYDISVPRNVEEAESGSESSEEDPLTADQRKKVNEIVNSYFERFDKNKDDVILRKELPRAVRTWGFNSYDSDGNGKLTRGEVRRQAEFRVK
jgi:hypothetical protein